jgi:cytochrome bd-type quinol oxidase subunit 2
MNLWLISLYVLVSLYLLTAWLRFFKQGTGMSTQQKVLSLLTIGIATVFWPLVLPIAYVRLLNATVSKS